MIPRRAARLVRDRLAEFPAVALVGPRQCGKTTLARSLAGMYYDLEQPPERLRLDLEFELRASDAGLTILDEAQAWPDLFPRLRAAIDHDRKRNGRFLILGSVSPALMTRVSESLAGRLSIVDLTPFLWGELDDPGRRRLWLRGGHPDGGVLGGRTFPQWQLDYLALLAQRDLPAWGMPAKPQATDRILRMIAALHGQVWNASQVARNLGVSYHTVNSQLDFLAAAFLIRRLPPWSGNLHKRLVRSPRVYWRDSGLLHALLNIPDERALLAHPCVGASWEGFIIEQAIGALSSTGRHFEAFHFRTHDGFEIDLVLEFGRVRWAIEVKLTSSPSPPDMDRLDKAADLIAASRRLLVSRTPRTSGTSRRLSCDLSSFLDVLSREIP